MLHNDISHNILRDKTLQQRSVAFSYMPFTGHRNLVKKPVLKQHVRVKQYEVNLDQYCRNLTLAHLPKFTESSVPEDSKGENSLGYGLTQR